MPKFEVVAERTEMISYEVEANTAAEAEERYLSDGEETASKTSSLSVVSVEEV